MSLVMSSSVPPEKRQEVGQKYQQLNSEVDTLRKELLRLDQDKEEHQWADGLFASGRGTRLNTRHSRHLPSRLVVDTISELNEGRPCYRLVNGVLMERTVGDLLPQLKETIGMVIWTCCRRVRVFRCANSMVRAN
jgi:chaperonin cofactor prefoldin